MSQEFSEAFPGKTWAAVLYLGHCVFKLEDVDKIWDDLESYSDDEPFEDCQPIFYIGWPHGR